MEKEKKARILVADDNEQLRQTLAEQLREAGYDVLEAASGNDAIPLLHGKEIHLAVLDLKMPYIEGYEVLKFIKASFPRTKTIILTAYSDLKNTKRCRDLGADEVMGKPYNIEELFARIRALLESPGGVPR
jgi:DNA-binding response OmpR family regulator